MSDTTEPDTGTTTPPDTGQTTPDTGTPAPDRSAEIEKWKSLAQKHEARAKENTAAAKELERLKRDAMNEQERAVAEATDRARTEAEAAAATKYGSRVVFAEVRAAAAGRLGAEQLDALTARLDPAGFLTDDGDVDTTAVASFVEALLPPPTSPGFPDLGQGPRGQPATSHNGDPLLRDLKSHLGIS